VSSEGLTEGGLAGVIIAWILGLPIVLAGCFLLNDPRLLKRL
jgi:hypothetical protein